MIHPFAEVAVVVPTCRGFVIPLQTIPCTFIVVHDQKEHHLVPPGQSVANFIPPVVENIVAPNPKIYGERTSAIRQAGLDYAYNRGYKYVLTLDDDCIIPPDWADRHVAALRGSVPTVNNTVPGEVIRGVPLGEQQQVGISHGLWSGVLDYPAWYQLAANPEPVEITDQGWSKISAPFPMCGMNVGFRREVLPAVYFQHQFLRHDDIFAGWFAQKVLSVEGYGFVNGGAVVQHNRASNAEANLEKERPGDVVNGWLMGAIHRAPIRSRGSVTKTAEWLRLDLEQQLLDVTNPGPEWFRLVHMINDMAYWAKERENI